MFFNKKLFIFILIIISSLSMLISCDNDVVWEVTSSDYSFKVTSISPYNGEAVNNGDINSDLRDLIITFSQPIDTSTFNAAFSITAGTAPVRYTIRPYTNYDRTVTIDLSTYVGTHNITINSTILKSFRGDSLNQDYTSTFDVR